MRKLTLASLLIMGTSLLFAQKEIPEYGKIDKSDVQLKECEFDKDAEAYKLLAFSDVHFDIVGEDIEIITDSRTRLKILKEKALDDANIKIRFYSKDRYEDIRNISGVTYNLDAAGNVVTTKLESSSVYTKKINNQLSEVTFTMPDVKVGSVFEYKFTDVKKSVVNVDDWDFQDDIPTRFSMYKILIPNIFRFVTQVLAYQNVEQKSEVINSNLYYHGSNVSDKAELRSFVLKNIPALQDEPFMPSQKDYLQRVVSQLQRIVYGNGQTEEVMSSWDKLTKELLDAEDFGLQLKKNIPHTKLLDDSLKNVNGDYNKMLAVYDYVRSNMNWNNSREIYSFQGVKTAWEKKSGSTAEINLILISLLRDAGLKAFPLLVSTKDNGRVNTVYPFLDQFNCTMTCVLIGDDKYVLNGADKYNPANLIPYDVLDNEGFIVDPEYGGWITLSDSKDRWKNIVSYSAEITPDAIMQGKATIYSYGYSKNPRVKKWKEDKSSFEDYFTEDLTALKVKNIELKYEDVDTMPLQQKLDFSIPLNASGEFKYFTLNLFQGLKKNPFIADERRTDIDFNYPKSYTLIGKVDLPDDYQFDELPKNIKMIMPDSSITLQRLIQSNSNAINFRITLDFARSNYPASSYPAFQEFYKKLFSTLNEQIVIKKKKTT